MAGKLPQLPRARRPGEIQTAQFGGVNYTNGGAFGELEDCRNLGHGQYPCLSQRRGRTQVEGMEGVTAVFDHGGKLITCRNGRLYLGEKDICGVSDGEKQFAVVNTQLVVWPDRIVISLTEERVLQDCEPVWTLDDASTVYDGSSITAPTYPEVSLGGDHIFQWYSGNEYTIYTYGNDREKLLACWDGNAWDTEKLAELEALTPVSETAGLFTIPSSDGQLISGMQTTAPDKSQYDTTGLYALIRISSYVINSAGLHTANTSPIRYRAGLENPRFYEHFAVGDRVDVCSGPFGLTGTEHAQIGTVDAGENSITLSGAEVLRRPVLYCTETVGRLRAGESLFFYYSYKYQGNTYETKMQLTPGEDIPEGCVLYCDKGDTTEYWSGSNSTGYLYGHDINRVRLWHEETRTAYGPYTPETAKVLPEEHFVLETYPDVYALAITRSLPELDCICASDNRLWGASNKEKTVWGSSLGKPFDFYTYAGLSTDSYAVAVGSDGDFTGCDRVGGNVAFFKEDRVHLLMGAEPEQYAMYEYGYAGAAKGSGGSMVTVNESLYYLGADGIYCFSSGGAPRCVSRSLGTRKFRNGVGGTDGRLYYISMEDRDTGAWGLWTYDTQTGYWLQEDDTKAVGFTAMDGTVYMAADGMLLQLNDPNSGEQVQWSATFCRTEEGTFERKGPVRLLLRYEMEAGSTMQAEICRDGGPWELLTEIYSEGHRTSQLPIKPGRCDSWRVRLSGTGTVLLRAIAREVMSRGER